MLVYGSVIQCIFWGGAHKKHSNLAWTGWTDPSNDTPAQGLARKVMIQPKSNSTKAFDQR